MRGDNHLLAVTTTADAVTGERKPLFAFPIQVCKGTDDSDILFDIAAPSGAPRTQQYIDSATGEPCEDADCQRGVRVGNEFHAISPEQIAEIAKATKIETMTALGVIDFEQIPFDRATGTYFLQSPPKGGVPKAYRILYEALSPVMSASGKTVQRPAKALVTKRTARSRQKLCIIYADTSLECLVLIELRFASQLRKPDLDVLAPLQAQVEQAQIDVARQVIDGLGDGLDAIETANDEVLTLREDLIEKAMLGDALDAPVPIAATVESADLMTMLEASLAQVG